MEKITSQFSEFMIDLNENYSDELNQYINMHNISVSEFAQSMIESSLLSLLIKKGFITEEEFIAEMRINIEQFQSVAKLKRNYDALMECIKAETEELR